MPNKMRDLVANRRAVAAMVHQHKGYEAPQGVRTSYTPLDLQESNRNLHISTHLREKNFRGMDKQNVVLPTDGNGKQVAHAQQARKAIYFHNAAMARYSRFMTTPTDMQRLNNPSQQAMVNQRQLRGPNSQSQFYAFMHALSAAFGSLQS